MRRLINSINDLMESKAAITLYNRDGTRNAAGRLLSLIARHSPAGLSFKDEERKLVQDLASSEFVAVVVDRAHVTQKGRDALA